jgi:hypothetical protein
MGTVDTEDLAKSLLIVMARPDSISHFRANKRDSDREVEGDVRHFAARCLALAELPPAREAAIVTTIRSKFPEVEREAFMAVFNLSILGVADKGESRVWRRESDSLDTVFSRVDGKGE